ncbi:MAG TPA: helix-turn-helix transcriptional regulator [Candidatus Limnocylindria bacterium]|nr:helix-turn-helix transcriptional regulator [Candidatus Limnocylindria bacterium]
MARLRHVDDLDRLIVDRTARNPEFPALMAAARARRELLRGLAAERERSGVSQTEIAAKMGTSQSAVARLERGESDARFSTVERLATALGKRVEYRLVPTAHRARLVAAARKR